MISLTGRQVRPGVGVTKALFVNFSVSIIFDTAKVTVTFLATHSYLTGVTAAELRQHLSTMNVIFNVLWWCWKIRKITKQRKLASEPPTTGPGKFYLPGDAYCYGILFSMEETCKYVFLHALVTGKMIIMSKLLHELGHGSESMTCDFHK